MAKCLSTGHWSPLITCSACSIPPQYANTVSQASLSTLGASLYSVTARILLRSNEVVNGISPAYRVQMWCHPQYGPNLTPQDPQYPVESQCSQADGSWSKLLTCVLCRTVNVRRRCASMAVCRSPCKFGPWTVPPDVYNVLNYV